MPRKPDAKGNRRLRGENHDRDTAIEDHSGRLDNQSERIDTESATRQNADTAAGTRIDEVRTRTRELEDFRNRPAGFAGNPHGSGAHSETYLTPQTGYPRENADARFLKTTLHPDFLGHSNAHHDPPLAVKNHRHSIAAYNTPFVQRQAIVDERAWLRGEWSGATDSEKLDHLRHFVLQMAHLALDQSDETFEQIHQKITADPAYRESVINRQTIEQNTEDYYYLNPGPDDDGGIPGPKPQGLMRNDSTRSIADVALYTIEEVA